MHEFGIAVALVEQVVRAAAEHRARKVIAVEVELGAMQLIVPEALTAAFAAASEGTVAQGAALRLREVPAQAVCGHCGAEYAPEIGCYVCPKCHRAEPKIVRGKEIVLTAVECETDEDQHP